jgi:hypothetical protein
MDIVEVVADLHIDDMKRRETPLYLLEGELVAAVLVPAWFWRKLLRENKTYRNRIDPDTLAEYDANSGASFREHSEADLLQPLEMFRLFPRSQ